MHDLCRLIASCDRVASAIVGKYGGVENGDSGLSSTDLGLLRGARRHGDDVLPPERFTYGGFHMQIRWRATPVRPPLRGRIQVGGDLRLSPPSSPSLTKGEGTQ